MKISEVHIQRNSRNKIKAWKSFLILRMTFVILDLIYYIFIVAVQKKFYLLYIYYKVRISFYRFKYFIQNDERKHWSNPLKRLIYICMVFGVIDTSIVCSLKCVKENIFCFPVSFLLILIFISSLNYFLSWEINGGK